MWKYKEVSQSKKLTRRLKILVGRVIRDVRKRMSVSGIELNAREREILTKVISIYKQSFLSKNEKKLGHLKNYGRMGRNYLQGIIGDIINPIISAIGLNLRCIAHKVLSTA